MSKLYQEYLRLKQNDDKKLYLFKNGKFYIFIGDDCDTINEYVVLKKVKFTKDTYKCGFPSDVLENYLRVFKNHKLNIEIVEMIESKDNDIEQVLRHIDINELSPMQALLKLKELKEMLK